MRKIKTLLVAAIAISLLAGSAAGAAAQEPETPTDGAGAAVVPPGPLGITNAEWAIRMRQWDQSNREVGADPDCAVGAQGDVFFLPYVFFTPFTQMEEYEGCTVASGQHILANLGSFICSLNRSLIKRADEAKGTKAKDLRQRATVRNGETFECMTDGFDEPFLSIDGTEIPIDDSFWTMGLTNDPRAKRDFFPGYYVMIEPLAPGSHTIEYGVTSDGDQFRVTAQMEVAEAAE